MRKIPFHYFALALLPIYVACGGEDDPGSGGNTAGSPGAAGSTPGASGALNVSGAGGTPAATGGAPGAAGTPAGMAGTPAGMAGTPAGMAGAGGGGGGAGGSGPTGSCAAPMSANGMVSTFDMNVANQLTTGTDVWSASPTGSMATAMGGVLQVKQTMGTWGSVSAVLNKGATCVNVAGKYTGIKFKISSPTNTSIKFVLVTPETKMDSSHFGKVLTVTSTPTEVPVLFSELAMATWGAGMTLVPPYKPEEHVVGIGFGVMEEAELMDITLDDVTFY